MRATTPFALLLSLLLAAVVAAAPAELEDFRMPAAVLGRRASSNGKKTDDRCSYTAQCPSCTSADEPGSVQCCWPYGKGYGSAFDAPGFCLCAPAGQYDYAQCNGGFWTS